MSMDDDFPFSDFLVDVDKPGVDNVSMGTINPEVLQYGPIQANPNFMLTLESERPEQQLQSVNTSPFDVDSGYYSQFMGTPTTQHGTPATNLVTEQDIIDSQGQLMFQNPTDFTFSQNLVAGVGQQFDSYGPDSIDEILAEANRCIQQRQSVEDAALPPFSETDLGFQRLNPDFLSLDVSRPIQDDVPASTNTLPFSIFESTPGMTVPSMIAPAASSLSELGLIASASSSSTAGPQFSFNAESVSFEASIPIHNNALATTNVMSVLPSGPTPRKTFPSLISPTESSLSTLGISATSSLTAHPQIRGNSDSTSFGVSRPIPDNVSATTQIIPLSPSRATPTNGLPSMICPPGFPLPIGETNGSSSSTPGTQINPNQGFAPFNVSNRTHNNAAALTRILPPPRIGPHRGMKPVSFVLPERFLVSNGKQNAPSSSPWSSGPTQSTAFPSMGPPAEFPTSQLGSNVSTPSVVPSGSVPRCISIVPHPDFPPYNYAINGSSSSSSPSASTSITALHSMRPLPGLPLARVATNASSSSSSTLSPENNPDPESPTQNVPGPIRHNRRIVAPRSEEYLKKSSAEDKKEHEKAHRRAKKKGEALPLTFVTEESTPPIKNAFQSSSFSKTARATVAQPYAHQVPGYVPPSQRREKAGVTTQEDTAIPGSPARVTAVESD